MPSLLPPEVLFADVYNRPVFQMGPHDATALARNAEIASATRGRQVDWRTWFGDGGQFTLTVNGREAIDLALQDLQLSRDDEVLIVTTSGSPYVSNCVTSSIEKLCRWSRVPGPSTRAIFLIHEFGFPARLGSDLLALNVPILEDCAYAMGTRPADGSTGTYGDYLIWSFSKALPMPYGGLLKSRRPLSAGSSLSPLAQEQAPLVAAHYLEGRDAAFARRREVFELYRARLGLEGLRPLFEPEPGVVPHAFIVEFPDQPLAEAMKPQLHAVGVISSVFYGGGGYFLPNHQNMGPAAVDYVASHFVKAMHAASAS